MIMFLTQKAALRGLQPVQIHHLLVFIFIFNFSLAEVGRNYRLEYLVYFHSSVLLEGKN